MKIGCKIVTLRKKYNYTQEELAEKIGVSRQTLSNWENDMTSPDLNQAIALVKVLKVNINELIDDKIEIECKEQKNIFSNIINKTCYLYFTDDFYDTSVMNHPVKVLSVKEDFIKIEYKEKKI